MINRLHKPNLTYAAPLVEQIEAASPAGRQGIHGRLHTLLSALGIATSAETLGLLEHLSQALAEPASDRIWLALAVLSGELPDQSAVLRARRAAELDGPLAALVPVVTAALSQNGGDTGERAWPRVEILAGQVVVDLHHTATAGFATGIQRVARETALRWCRDHDPVVVGWTPGYRALRRLRAQEVDPALQSALATNAHEDRTGDIVVPWRSTYVSPELLAEPPRAQRLQALVRFSGNQSGFIGFDCVPLTTAETVAAGMETVFAGYLSALAHADRLAPISEGAAVEYQGWRAMLAGTGLNGPQITPIPLAVETSRVTDAALQLARDQLRVPGMPMVLVVGSHEPRKNHLAVLHAAELLWREGLTFSLLFAGGNAWNSERFQARLHLLQAMNRPVHAYTALSDELLWAAYRTSHCTVFPSLNEGFGLPVAESLASGTPVVTSDFGSMREIAEGGGALLVDPRNDHDIASALKRLLTDEVLHAELSAQAHGRPVRSWERYAAETWSFLVNGEVPNQNDPSRASSTD